MFNRPKSAGKLFHAQPEEEEQGFFKISSIVIAVWQKVQTEQKVNDY